MEKKKKLNDKLILRLRNDLEKAKVEFSAKKTKKNEALIEKIKRQIAAKKSLKPYINSKIKNGSAHDKAKAKLYNLVEKRMHELAMKKGMDLNPDVYLAVLRHHLEERGYRIGRDFIITGKDKKTRSVADLDNMPLGQVIGMFNHLNRIFKDQNMNKKIGRNTKANGLFNKIKALYSDASMDPALAAITHDGTLKALEVVLKSQQVIDQAYHDEIGYASPIKDDFRKLKIYLDETMHSFGDFYNVNDDDYKNTASDKERKMQDSFDNVQKLVNDLMDGQTRYLNRAEFTYDKDGKIVEKEDFKQFFNMLKYIKDNNFAGEHLGRNVQLVTINNKRMFYTMVKDNKANSYTYKAYLVPVKYEEGSRYPNIISPFTMNNKREWVINPEWKEYYQEHQYAFNNHMDNGFYQAQNHMNYKGSKNKDGVQEDIYENGYIDYQRIDVPDKLFKDVTNTTNHSNTINVIETLINSFKNVHEDVSSRQNAVIKRIEKSLKKLTSMDYKKLGYDNEQDFNDMIGLGDEALGLFKNIYINDDGSISTENTFNRKIRDHYSPRMYWDDIYIESLLKSQKGMQAEIDSINIKLNRLDMDNQKAFEENDFQEISNISRQRVILEEKIKDLEDSIEVNEEKIGLSTGEIDSNNVKNLTLEKIQKYGKARKRFMDPMKRRKDAMVYTSYLHETYHTLNFNELKAELIDALSVLDKDMAVYLIDHVSAASGNTNTKAHFMGVDFNNEVWANRINSFFRKRGDKVVTPDKMHNAIQIYNTTVSASVLRSMSSISNNMQRINYMIWEDWDVVNDSFGMVYSKDPKDRERAIKIAEKAGVLDLIQSLSDALLGGLSADSRWSDGMAPIKDMVLLKGNKVKFLNSNTMYKDLLIKNLASVQGIDETSVNAEQVKLLLTDMWEIAHDLKKGDLSEKRIKALMKKFADNGLAMNHLNKYARWGLTYMPGPLKKVMTFTGVEAQMRTETAIIGAKMAVKLGHVPKEWIDEGNDPLMHPEAIKMARIVTYKHMFGMSTQFLPKMFRGTGKVAMQYKQYTYKQWIQDYQIYQNVYNSYNKSITGRNVFRESIDRIVTGWKSGDNILDKINELRQSNKDLNRAAAHFISRGIITYSTIMLTYIPIVNEITKYVAKPMLRGVATSLGMKTANPLKRGFESPLFALPGRLLYVAFMMLSTDEEDREKTKKDEKILTQFGQDWTPMLLNILFTATQKGKEGILPALDHVSRYVPGGKAVSTATKMANDLFEDEED